ncbi:MAG: hypothetical protein ACR2PY_02905 [Salinispira sp.]
MNHFLMRALHFLEKMSLYFLCASLAVFLLYILGNFQIFLEDTQLLLLSMVQIMSIVGIDIIVYYILFLFYWSYTRKKILVRHFLYGFCILLGDIFLAVISLLVQEFTQGIA